MEAKIENPQLRALDIKNQILELTKDYYQLQFNQKKDFREGDRVNYAGRFFGEEEMTNLVDSSLEFWLTSGRYTDAFEEKLAKEIGLPFALFVNSGSSANLLAFMTLTSPLLKDRRVKRGDEVITVAAGFPTTVAPIVQYGAVPVFVDVSLPSYNIDCSQLEEALSPKTRAVMVAHTLGNPFDVKKIKDFCTKHNLFLIEDNCDALGSEYCLDGQWKRTGSFGDIGTSSFYPPHHLTTGEGGAVYTKSSLLKRAALSIRDWGRDCYCPSGKDNTCGKRFDFQLGDLPKGYDHKYIYSHFGYNLKASDMQAAIGVAQLDRLSLFTKRRRENWNYLYEGVKDLEEWFILPRETEQAKASWFGFPLTLKKSKQAHFTRKNIVQHLEAKNIQTRMLFGGNILKHPCFVDLKKSDPDSFRVVGDLKITDTIMEDTFWLGVYPGLESKQLDFVIEEIRRFTLSH